MNVALQVVDGDVPVAVKLEDLSVGHRGQPPVHAAQLDLSKRIDFEQESLDNVIVKTSDGKAGLVVEVQYIFRILPVQRWCESVSRAFS